MRTILTYLFALISTTLAVCAFLFSFIKPEWLTKDAKGAILAFWLVFPPLWFWFEYCFLFKGQENQESLESFKYAHEVSRNLWIGISAALTLLYFGHP